MPRTRRLVLPVLVATLAASLTPFAAVAEPAAPAVVDDVLELRGAAVEEVDAADRAELPEVVEEVREAEVELGLASVDEAPAPGTRTAVLEAPIAFTGVYVEVPEGVDEVAVRVRADGGAWEPWTALGVLDELDGPDAGTEEAARAREVATTDLLTTDAADHVQLEVDADVDVDELTVRFLDVDGLNEGAVARFARQLRPQLRAAEASSVPSWVQPRSTWGAAAPKKANSVASFGVRQIVVHHTAGQNNLGDCNRDRIRSTIRNIQHYHMNGQGWNDIGYNVVIDPCGGVWEGRAGGADQAVIGAHAAGFNANSSGIAVLGNFTTTTPNNTVLGALDRVVGWKAGIHGVDATGTVTIDGRSYPTVVGHRDVGQTSCPGSIHGHLWRVRTNAAQQAPSYPRVPDGGRAFWDIAGSPHEDAIEELVAREVTGGFTDGSFRPSAPITRAQVAAFLHRGLGLDPIPGSQFSDFDASYVHAASINALVEEGILNGFSDGTFRPNAELRREHMAAILQRALDLPLTPEAASRFGDVIGYLGEIGAIADAGITTGFTDGTFRPADSVTRGQMATFLTNALGRLDGGPSEDLEDADDGDDGLDDAEIVDEDDVVDEGDAGDGPSTGPQP